MGLSASMWGSVSGLLGHGEKMNVVGNNIANVSTVGFKGQRMDFQDFIYQDTNSASGAKQMGRGVNISTIMGDFSQGAFETTNSATDLAIGGNGYFQVRSEFSKEMHYTRAGNFYFNEEGVLGNPAGYILQGWKIDNSSLLSIGTQLGQDVDVTPSAFKGSGVPVDIKLDTWTIPPKATSKVKLTGNLSAENGNDKSTNIQRPMTSLYTAWDGANEPPLSDQVYATQTTIAIFDEGGVEHNLTVYFDQVSPKGDGYEIENFPDGYRMYEYIVTIPPSEDKRTYGGQYNNVTKKMEDIPAPVGGQANTVRAFHGTTAAGLLGVGTLLFNGAGQLVNQSLYTYQAQANQNPNLAPTANPVEAASWHPTKISSNGLPIIAPNFTGQPLASSVSEEIEVGGAISSPTQKYGVELDLGLKNLNPTDPWDNIPNNNPQTLANLNGTPVNPPNGTFTADFQDIANMSNSKADSDAYTSTANSSQGRTRIQNGYTSGMLKNVEIDEYGVVTGSYSNGVNLGLYQLALYDFNNEQGLRREGGNLFSQTMDSGNPSIGVANDGGFGSVNAYSLEQSNVDLSREFVQMISTQRGFQANSKSITTVDTMLETVINMKR